LLRGKLEDFFTLPLMIRSIRTYLVVLLLAPGVGLRAQEKIKIFTGCASDNLVKNAPEILKLQRKIDNDAFKYFNNPTPGINKVNAIDYVPVVVHIIHNNGPENISDLQVQTAIADINAKFLASNNYQIQFCLAQRDPLGNPTTGITRDVSAYTIETMELDDITLKNINRWDPLCYLNIWVIQDILSLSMGSGVIGYATFPSSHGQNNDGVVIEAGYFGTNATDDAVGTHELGHYFGLYHTFESGCTNFNCLTDGDQVCDTPPDQTTFASCSPPANSCNTDTDDPSANNPFTTDVSDLSDDYMDYSNLACYNQFTAGQYSRMKYFLTNVRYSLLGCLSCSTPCPSPLSAQITNPSASQNILSGTTLNFTATAANSSSFQWYITPGNNIGTGLSASYTFNTGGTYWVKFKAVSGNPSLCLDAVDSIQIVVTEAVVTACNGSLLFDNSCIGVYLPALPSGNVYYSAVNGGYTWECWFRLNQPFGSNSRPLISAVDAVLFEDMWLGFGWQGGWFNEPVTKLVFKVDGPNSTVPSGPNCAYAPPGGYVLGTWYHAAGVMDYTLQQAKLYVNGSLVDTKPITTPPITRVIPTELSFGWIGNQISLEGNMDEVKIWDKPLSATEISSYYTQCRSGTEQNLMLYYHCNQSAGSSVLDATPNGNNGTFSSATGWSPDQVPLTGTTCIAGCIEICGNAIDDNNNGLIDEGCSCPEITAGMDTSICPGQTVQLNSSPGFVHYQWTPAAGLSNDTIANPVAAPSVSTAYVVTGTNTGPELVVNPDFSAGNIGFTSGQTYTSVYSPCNYYVGPSFFTLTGSFPDHSPSSDNYMMAVDGCGAGPTLLWEETMLALQPNTNYRFSFWATRADQVQPNFEVHFNGNVSGNIITSTTPGIPYAGVWTWDEYGTVNWNSGSNTSVIVSVINLQTNTFGNDFSLDDFSFRQVCTDTDTIVIKVHSNAIPLLNLGNDLALCISGTHTFDAGPGFQEYLWFDGGTQQSNTIYGPGKYWVTVKDSCGGTHSDTVKVTLLPLPLLELGSDTSVCINDSIQLGASGVFSTYQWTPATGLSCVTCAHPNASPIAPVKYFLAATTADGCTVSDSLIVLISPNSITGLVVSQRCDLLYGSVTINNVNGGMAPYLYSFGNSGFIPDSVFNGLIPGTYNYTVQDSKGCTYDSSVVVLPNNGPLAADIITADVTCSNNGSLKVGEVYGGIPPYLYNFNYQGFSTETDFTDLTIGNYYLEIKDGLNCAFETIIELQGESYDGNVFIPNCFTPNGDTRNETWYIVGECIKKLECYVFNRWGEKIALLDEPLKEWNGKYKNETVPDGTYVYVAVITYYSGKTEKKSGTVTVIR
jgi:gliding motility-associated-like protein